MPPQDDASIRVYKQIKLTGYLVKLKFLINKSFFIWLRDVFVGYRASRFSE